MWQDAFEHYINYCKVAIWQAHSFFMAYTQPLLVWNSLLWNKNSRLINCKLRIESRKLLKESFEVVVWVSNIIHSTHFSDAMHRQLRCPNIDCADANPTGQDWAYRRTTLHIISHHEILCKTRKQRVRSYKSIDLNHFRYGIDKKEKHLLYHMIKLLWLLWSFGNIFHTNSSLQGPLNSWKPLSNLQAK